MIYAGLLALAVLQLAPSRRGDPRQRRVGWLVAASMLLSAAWILSVQVGWLALSVAVILALLATLVAVFVRLLRVPPSSPVEAVVLDGTMNLYLGWVVVATVANVAAALAATRTDWLALGPHVRAVAVLVLAAAVGVVLAVVGRGRLAPAAALAWGLLLRSTTRRSRQVEAGRRDPSSAWACAASTAAIRPWCRSSPLLGWTTCPARLREFRCRG